MAFEDLELGVHLCEGRCLRGRRGSKRSRSPQCTACRAASVETPNSDATDLTREQTRPLAHAQPPRRPSEPCLQHNSTRLGAPCTSAARPNHTRCAALRAQLIIAQRQPHPRANCSTRSESLSCKAHACTPDQRATAGGLAPYLAMTDSSLDASKARSSRCSSVSNRLSCTPRRDDWVPSALQLDGFVPFQHLDRPQALCRGTASHRTPGVATARPLRSAGA